MLGDAAVAGTGKPRVWHFEAPFVPTPAQLDAFAGVYVSDELGVTYTVLNTNGKLVVCSRPVQRVSLTPAFTDGFEAAFIWGAAVAAVGIVVSLVLIRRSELETPVEEHEEAPETVLEAA